MNKELLPSGSYRVRITIEGKRYTFIFDHKPTNLEIEDAKQNKILELNRIKTESLTFKKSSEKYLESKKDIISPSTYEGYKRIVKQIPNWFMDFNIYEIEQITVNKLINEYAKKGLSTKTMRNRHGYITAVLATFRPSLVLRTVIPKKAKEEAYMPSTEDIKKILDFVKDRREYTAFALGCYGMRKSEILALTVDDIKGTTVTINKAMVRNSENVYVLKNSTKTETSTREIIIPKELANRIKKQGYVTDLKPAEFNDNLTRIEKQLGIEHFSFHKFRHFFAAKLSDLGIPEADILALGGWKTDRIMKEVYRYSMIEKKKDAKKNASDKLAQSIL